MAKISQQNILAIGDSSLIYSLPSEVTDLLIAKLFLPHILQARTEKKSLQRKQMKPRQAISDRAFRKIILLLTPQLANNKYFFSTQ